MARMRVQAHESGVGNFIIYRDNGDTLSLSSMGNSLIHWAAGKSNPVKDYGPCYDVAQFLQIAAEFIADKDGR